MSQVIGLDAATSGSQTIYDPTCGSGSLLLKVVRKKGDKKIEGTIQDGKDEFICDLVLKELLIHRYFSKE